MCSILNHGLSTYPLLLRLIFERSLCEKCTDDARHKYKKLCNLYSKTFRLSANLLTIFFKEHILFIEFVLENAQFFIVLRPIMPAICRRKFLILRGGIIGK